MQIFKTAIENFHFFKKIAHFKFIIIFIDLHCFFDTFLPPIPPVSLTSVFLKFIASNYWLLLLHIYIYKQPDDSIRLLICVQV